MNKPTFILIHGAWHDSSCWRYVTPVLEHAGYDVLTPDLPGSAKNPLDPSKTTLNKYSRYISHLTDNKDNIVLVGHSMSGIVISQLTEILSHKIQRLVYLCAYVPEQGDSLFSLIEKIRSDKQPFAVEKIMALSKDNLTFKLNKDKAKELFYNCSTDENAQQYAQLLTAQPTLPFRGKVNLTAENFDHCPKTYISGLQDRVIPIHTQRKMASSAAIDEYIQLDCDHSPFYSCPQELAGILLSVSQN